MGLVERQSLGRGHALEASMASGDALGNRTSIGLDASLVALSASVIAAMMFLLSGCGSQAEVAPKTTPVPTVDPRIPREPGEMWPSLVTIDRTAFRAPDEVTEGTQLSDVDSCATCHPDAAAHWGGSAHSFASFGNPIYRTNVELLRADLGHKNSRHCGGCHDMPLMTDGLMTNNEPIPADDLRAHSGVTCSLCHGIQSATKDGNGSYVWSRAPITAPTLGDATSIAAHKAQASAKAGTEMCVSCHRGFMSADMDMPVHLSGLDEPGMWRNSAWAGNGMGRVDKVEKKNCIDCHMEREPATKDELGAKNGTIASHRFLGGHTWMASMRDDKDHLKRTQAKLEGVASIDVAGARTESAKGATWHLPADGAPVTPGSRMSIDVVLRNLLVGHRFPGGVLDIQDTWIEVEVFDAKGGRLAASGMAHEKDPDDQEAHVLQTLVVDEKGEVLVEHEMSKFRTQIATQTLAAREAQVTRYVFDVPATLAPAQLPLTVNARLRHRSRTLKMQATVCKTAMTDAGKAFLVGAKGARDVVLDPCKDQPITLIAQTAVQLGAGAKISTARPAWDRHYEHGMALVNTVTERLEEARHVLETALAGVPAATNPDGKRARAMVLVQLGWVASKQGRADDALAFVAEARALLPAPGPAVLDAIATDALARVWRWEEAIAPARACAERAPGNSQAWVMLARVLGSVGDDRGALEAATKGLEYAPRDQDLLRSQATALAALGHPLAKAALDSFERFRSPDQSADLRIQCAADNVRCARDRELGHTIVMTQTPPKVAAR
jgi:tetratricopeptide (TPR) repeat protein/nitrate/TMAO reductase-like tetraheme cytochrome c subunit